MISCNINMKLPDAHLEALKGFADRCHAVTTTDAIKRLIETLPEYNSSTDLRDDTNPSLQPENTSKDNQCQGENTNA